MEDGAGGVCTWLALHSQDKVSIPDLACRPPKLQLEAGVKITRSEYNTLQELGIGVAAPAAKA
jgi:hypothetical protein